MDGRSSAPPSKVSDHVLLENMFESTLFGRNAFIVSSKDSSMALTYRETQYVKGMLNRGDRQHDIAAYFGVNAGRIAEVATGNCAYPNAEPMDAAKLPPPGPYVTKYALSAVVAILAEAQEALNLAEADVNLGDAKAAIELASQTLVGRIAALEEA